MARDLQRAILTFLFPSLMSSEEGEWYIESIYSQKVESGKGQKSVLYLVKWEGVEEPSWHTKDELYDYDTAENIEREISLMKQKEKSKKGEKKKDTPPTPKKESNTV
jgi:hypothetical protein